MEAAKHIGDRSTVDRDRGLSLYRATRRSVGGKNNLSLVIQTWRRLVGNSMSAIGTEVRRAAGTALAFIRERACPGAPRTALGQERVGLDAAGLDLDHRVEAHALNRLQFGGRPRRQ